MMQSRTREMLASMVLGFGTTAFLIVINDAFGGHPPQQVQLTPSAEHQLVNNIVEALKATDASTDTP